MASTATPASVPTQDPSRNDWRDAVWASDLATTPRMVALVYADHAGDRGPVWVTLARGLERSGIKRHETWSKAVAELVTAGWLVEVETRTNKRAARYQLAIPAECAERAPKDRGVRVTSTPGCESVALQSASESHQTPARTPTRTPTSTEADDNSEDSSSEHVEAAAMHTDPDTPPTDEAHQLAALWETSTDVATSMLTIAAADPKVTSPMGLLRHPEWATAQRIHQRAIERARADQEQTARDARRATAAQTLGPRPADHWRNSEGTRLWDTAANMLQRHPGKKITDEAVADWHDWLAANAPVAV